MADRYGPRPSQTWGSCRAPEGTTGPLNGWCGIRRRHPELVASGEPLFSGSSVEDRVRWIKKPRRGSDLSVVSN